MNMPPHYSRSQFEKLVADHQQMVELINDLELRLYQMGEAPEQTPIAQCQKTAGALIGQLRNLLFQWDQEVLPLLDTLAKEPLGSHQENNSQVSHA